MHFNGRDFGKRDYLIVSQFKQKWDGENINPPPPHSSIRITDVGEDRITDSDEIRITD